VVRPGASPDEAMGEGSTLTSDLLDGFALEIARIFTLATTADGDSQ
jgi:hypothetical protein